MFNEISHKERRDIMAGAMLSATVFDIIAVMVLIFGFLNEEKVVEFEDRLILAAGRAYKRYMRRRYIKKKAAQKAHLHAVPSQQSSVSFRKSA